MKIKNAVIIENGSKTGQTLRNILSKKHSFKIDSASELKRGLQLLNQDTDIVLLALNLPDSKGLDTFNEVCKQAPKASIVLLCDSKKDEPLIFQALNQGAQDYLVKDRVPTEYLDVILSRAIDRKHFEEKFPSFQKTAVLDRLAYAISHEVMNPLTILSMNVSRAILKYRKNPETPLKDLIEIFEKMEKYVLRIKEAVQMLTGIMHQSKKGKFEPVSIRWALQETLPLVEFQTFMEHWKESDIEFDIPANIPLVRADLERLMEVFLNLFVNAYDAVKGQDKRRIRVAAEIDPKDSSRVAIRFTDNGPGIDEELGDRIFNLGVTTKPEPNSGIGLFKCKRILELHDGDIYVESKKGEGATFTVLLPIYEGAIGGNFQGQEILPPANGVKS